MPVQNLKNYADASGCGAGNIGGSFLRLVFYAARAITEPSVTFSHDCFTLGVIVKAVGVLSRERNECKIH